MKPNNPQAPQKQIKIFEAFCGIGAQFEALKIVSKTLNFNAVSCGSIDWFVDAIVAYQELHFPHEVVEASTSKTLDEMRDLVKQLALSVNSKSVCPNLIAKINKPEFAKFLPHIYSFFSKEHNFSNISDCKNIPSDIDIFTYSFPCQDLSSQGKQIGFVEGGRSNLLYQVGRLLENSKDSLPKVLVMENVSNLANARFIGKLKEWIKYLKKLGYQSSYKVLVASNYGSAQARKRLFLVSWLDNSKKFVWPKKSKTTKTLRDVIDCGYSDFSLCEKLNNYQRTGFKKTLGGLFKARLLGYTNFNSENQVFLADGFGPTLTASGANSKIKIFFTEEKKIRFLNPVEAGVYMGFSESRIQGLWDKKFFIRSKFTYLLGNSISIEILTALFTSIVKTFFTDESNLLTSDLTDLLSTSSSNLDKPSDIGTGSLSSDISEEINTLEILK